MSVSDVKPILFGSVWKCDGRLWYAAPSLAHHDSVMLSKTRDGLRGVPGRFAFRVARSCIEEPTSPELQEFCLKAAEWSSVRTQSTRDYFEKQAEQAAIERQKIAVEPTPPPPRVMEAKKKETVETYLLDEKAFAAELLAKAGISPWTEPRKDNPPNPGYVKDVVSPNAYLEALLADYRRRGATEEKIAAVKVKWEKAEEAWMELEKWHEIKQKKRMEEAAAKKEAQQNTDAVVKAAWEEGRRSKPDIQVVQSGVLSAAHPGTSKATLLPPWGSNHLFHCARAAADEAIKRREKGHFKAGFTKQLEEREKQELEQLRMFIRVSKLRQQHPETMEFLMVWQRPDYRYGSHLRMPMARFLDHKEHDPDGGEALLLVDHLVSVPVVARKLDWELILQHVHPSGHAKAKRLILEHYLDAFIDGDHKVAFTHDDTALRFHPTKHATALGNMLAAYQDDLSYVERRYFLRKKGIRLHDYMNRQNVGHHIRYHRPLDGGGKRFEKGAEVKPCWFLYEDE
jgi:hypothetical protein